MIIGQSVYNIPALTYLLETKIFLIVEYHLKCCSVANDTVPDCHMVFSGVVDKAISVWHGRLHTCVRADGQHLQTFALSHELFLTDFAVL